MEKYDAVVIGSGLGGLVCADILSKEGMHVCILEKNAVTGGCMQTFTRGVSRFDTGMHYTGSLDKGAFLNTFFSYLGIAGKLRLRRLDEDGYDVIRYKGRDYNLPMGHERLEDELSQTFPSEIKGIREYSAKVREVGNSIESYTSGSVRLADRRFFDYYGTCYADFLENTISDPVLRNVLSGMSMLYSGMRESAPLYIPLMIHSSFMNGAYRFIDGGSGLQDLLCGNIISQGGTIIKNFEVTAFRTDSSGIVSAVSGDREISGRYFIAGIHPKKILSIAGTEYFKPAYIRRINSLQETFGMFTLYLSSSDSGFPYVNRNYYCYDTEEIWNVPFYSSDTWPEGYMLHYSPVSGNQNTTNTIIVNTYLKWEEVEPWAATQTGRRGKDYEDFKEAKASRLLEVLNKEFPEIVRAVTSYYTSTPLTYRDYTGTVKGSAYGIRKDCRRPFETMILPATHIPNLLLTGQNTNTHGVAGVTMSAVITCSEILGGDYLRKKISNGTE